MPSSGVQTCALRSEEHTSELQSHDNLVCRLLLEKIQSDRKSTRLNSSHTIISYAVFCFIRSEVFEDICSQLGVIGKHTTLTRRNVLTWGVDLNSLIGEEFTMFFFKFDGVHQYPPSFPTAPPFAP